MGSCIVKNHCRVGQIVAFWDKFPAGLSEFVNLEHAVGGSVFLNPSKWLLVRHCWKSCTKIGHCVPQHYPNQVKFVVKPLIEKSYIAYTFSSGKKRADIHFNGVSGGALDLSRRSSTGTLRQLPVDFFSNQSYLVIAQVPEVE